MSTSFVDDLLDLGQDEVVEIVTLTDGELAVVADESVTPLPTIVGEPDQALLDASLQSLMARGLVADDEGTLRIDPSLEVLVAARRGAAAYLLAEQQVRDASQTIALYLHARDRSLLEEVTGDGLHRFAAMPSPGAVEDLAAWAAADARDADLADGDATLASVVEVGLDEFEERAEDLVGWAHRVTVFGAVRAGRDDRRLTVYSAPTDVVVALPLPGARLRVVRVDLTMLAGLLASMLLDREES